MNILCCGSATEDKLHVHILFGSALARSGFVCMVDVYGVLETVLREPCCITAQNFHEAPVRG